MPQIATWGKRLYIPSEGRHDEDFKQLCTGCAKVQNSILERRMLYIITNGYENVNISKYFSYNTRCNIKTT
jgi:hypothetical protein